MHTRGSRFRNLEQVDRESELYKKEKKLANLATELYIFEVYDKDFS